MKNIDIKYKFENKVLYTGTHDCNTIVGWYKSLELKKKRKLREFLKNEKCNDLKIHKAIMKYGIKNNAKILIVPLQDVLGLDENSRINVPGKTLDKNWSWKLDSFKSVGRKIKCFFEW